MKTRTIITSVLCACLFAACGVIKETLSSEVLALQSTPSLAVTPKQDTATPYPTSTPTIGYQATANAAMTNEEAARLTSVAANVAVAQITAQADAMKLESERLIVQVAQITQAAEVLELQQEVIALTAAPVSATAEQEQREMAVARITQEAAYPTIVRANAENENYILYGAKSEWAKIFLLWVSVACIALLGVFIFVKLIQSGRDRQVQEHESIANADIPEEPKHAMHFEQVSPTVTRRINPYMPCSIHELTEFAEGLLRLNKTMAFGQWEGTPVHKRLADLRQWMEFNRLSVPIPGYTNEYMPTPSGLKFLQFALDNGTTPAPYICMDDGEKAETKTPEPAYHPAGFTPLNNGEETHSE